MKGRSGGDPLLTDFDLAEGHVRFRQALARLDVRTGEILASHIALEAELDMTFEALFARPAALSKMGFSNKVRILLGVYDHAILDMIGEPLQRFDELRNSIAHRHDKRQIRGAFAKLCQAMKLEPATATIQGTAQALTSGLSIARDELIPTR